VISEASVSLNGRPSSCAPPCLEIFSRSRRGGHGGTPVQFTVGGFQLSGHLERALPLLISVFVVGVF
jgi:hypothetical protein